ncbi:calcium-dependent secretion activator 2 isoform 2-T2 [Pholidichthys leucotaenia]
MVQSGGCSANDFREVFKKNIERRVRSLPDSNGLSKETVLSSWMSKFDSVYGGDDDGWRRAGTNLNVQSELILSKEQLFQMFQTILGVQKVEHQLLYNGLQLDNVDEQAAQIRRELDGRLQQVDRMARGRTFPVFVSSDMDLLFVEEQRSSISVLMSNLESVPVSRGAPDFKHKLKRSSISSSFLDVGDDGDVLSKSDIQLSFSLEVIIMEIQGLKSVAPNRVVYVTMEMEGGQKLQTDHAEASRPQWGTQGDFTTTHPLPSVKVKLFTENTGVLALEDKELGRLVLTPTVGGPKQAQFHRMDTPKNSLDSDLRIRLSVRLDRPANVKHTGFVYVVGQRVWKRWKRRYLVLVQVSQYTFAVCSYREKRAEPQELMQLDGYTVDYCRPPPGVQGGRFFFSAVREGDQVTFGCDDEQDRLLWVQSLYRATGQSYKPKPPPSKTASGGGAPKPPSASSVDPSERPGLDELISTPPCDLDHGALFSVLQKLTLKHRMNDSFSCLGWFSPGQVFVLDEYCARYGVRGCIRHLSYLKELMEYAENSILVDPTLLHYSYAFCASHIHGNRPDGTLTVTVEEQEEFYRIRDQLMKLLENQISHFRYCFPFGRPDGALKATLSLQERVLMDGSTPVSPEDLRTLLCSCLQRAAHINYGQLVEFANVTVDGEASAERQLEDVMRLGELCIEVLQQNDEHHSEAFLSWSNLMTEHAETFLSLYGADMDAALQVQPIDSWNSFPLFQLLNNFLRPDPHLSNGAFHKHLQDLFVPLVVRYIDLMEASIAQSVHRGLENETWHAVSNGSASSEDLFWKLDALQMFVIDLNWPDPEFAKHLDQRLKLMSMDMMEACVKRTKSAFDGRMQRANKSTDFRVSSSVCTMFNVIVDAKKQSSKLCVVAGANESDHQWQYHPNTHVLVDETIAYMTAMLVSKFSAVLDGVLSKLSQYDEGSLFFPLLSLTKPRADLADKYVTFVRQNQDIVRERVSEEIYVDKVFEHWYMSWAKTLCVWLTARVDLQLHPYQLRMLIKMVKETYRDFRLQGVLDPVLNNKSYETVYNRLTVEEATAAVRAAHDLQGVSMRDSGEDEPTE